MCIDKRLLIAANLALLTLLPVQIIANDIFIDQHGNVGVGTNSPQEHLHLKRNGRAALKVSSGNNNSVLDLSHGNDSSWKIYTNQHEKLYLVHQKPQSDLQGAFFTFTKDGRLGVGHSSPSKGKLHVVGSVTANVGGFAYYAEDPDGDDYNYNWVHAHDIGIGIYSNRRVVGTEFNAFSDARIKVIKKISDQEEDLDTLEKIEITDYTLRENRGKGKVIKKVIGQQVQEVFPTAVNITKDYVFDVMMNYPVVNGRIDARHGRPLIPELTSELDERPQFNPGDKLKVLFDNNTEAQVTVKYVNNGLIVLDKAIPKSVTRVIVFGREVDDFHSVDYEALAMLNVSATQALAKKNDRLAEQVKALRIENKKLGQELRLMKSVLCEAQDFDFCEN